MPASGVFSKVRPLVARHKTSLQPIKEEEERKHAGGLQNIAPRETAESTKREEELHVTHEEIENKSPRGSFVVDFFNRRTFNWKTFFGAVYALAATSYQCSMDVFICVFF